MSPVSPLRVIAALTLCLSPHLPVWAQSKDLGPFGATCPVAPSASAVPGPVEDPTPPAPVQLIAVLAATCPQTPDALAAIQRFRAHHPEVQLELILTDLGAFRALPEETRIAFAQGAEGLEFSWSPTRLRALGVERTPYFRIERAGRRAVTALGVPDLDALLGAAP